MKKVLKERRKRKKDSETKERKKKRKVIFAKVVFTLPKSAKNRTIADMSVSIT